MLSDVAFPYLLAVFAQIQQQMTLLKMLRADNSPLVSVAWGAVPSDVLESTRCRAGGQGAKWVRRCARGTEAPATHRRAGHRTQGAASTSTCSEWVWCEWRDFLLQDDVPDAGKKGLAAHGRSAVVIDVEPLPDRCAGAYRLQRSLPDVRVPLCSCTVLYCVVQRGV